MQKESKLAVIKKINETVLEKSNKPEERIFNRIYILNCNTIRKNGC